jgi:hypothetical protein
MMKKYLLVALVIGVLTAAASTPSSAALNNRSSLPSRNATEVRKKPRPAHHVVTNRGKKKNDFSHLNH